LFHIWIDSASAAYTEKSHEHFANYDHDKPLTLLHEELNEAEFEGVMISECLCNVKGVYWYVRYEQ
jgi:hypothetical protein